MDWIKPPPSIEVDAATAQKMVDTVLLVCLAERAVAQWSDLTGRATDENAVERQVWREIVKQVSHMASDDALATYLNDSRIRTAVDGQFRQLEYIAARMVPAVERVLKQGMQGNEAFKQAIDEMMEEFSDE